MIREFLNLEMLENYAEPGDVAHAVVMSCPYALPCLRVFAQAETDQFIADF